MARYENGDTATFYFVIKSMNNDKIIKGWTDSKILAEFYMEFHNCKSYRMKKVTDTMGNINRIIEENLHDGIELMNIITRRRSKPGELKVVTIPATSSEMTFLRDEIGTFLSGQINYGSMNDIIPYFKNRYQKALDKIYLNSIIKKTIHNKLDPFNQGVELDHLKLFFRLFVDDFG